MVLNGQGKGGVQRNYKNESDQFIPKWSFTKYDGLNRPIITGTEVYPTGTRATLQTTASASVTFAESLAANTAGYTIINTFPVLDAPVTFEILNIIIDIHGNKNT